MATLRQQSPCPMHPLATALLRRRSSSIDENRCRPRQERSHPVVSKAAPAVTTGHCRGVANTNTARPGAANDSFPSATPLRSQLFVLMP